ncbi:MAG TPA: 4-alpha-glucanotransferase, partial [Aquella sp.]|nr:4-alpha-glucanotransferase [Aquella sp.]
MRKSGCLMPTSSLPSPYGIGDFGYSAYEFIDIIYAMGMKIWQVLPLNPLGYGNSPYQPYSSFAGDEIYISIDKLVAAGLLDKHHAQPFNANSKFVDYIKVRDYKQPSLQLAFKNFNQSNQYQNKYKIFINENEWINDYAVFVTFKKINNLDLWTKWPDKYKNWPKIKQLDLSKYTEQINYEKFIQFIFYWQWTDLKAYANKQHIQIMGDIPIYLGLDSADV